MTWLARERITQAIDRLPKGFLAGRVNRVLGLMIEGYLPGVPVGAACQIEFQGGNEMIAAEVIALKGEQAMLMPVGTTAGIKVGDWIRPVRDAVTVRVTNDLLGRIIDGSGEPLDGGPPILHADEYTLYTPAISPVSRRRLTTPLTMGVRVIDSFLTCAEGQRVSIMAGSGVGKSVLLGMLARHSTADVKVIALVGERGREVREFIEHDLGQEGLRSSVVIVATSDAPALVRMRAAFVATTIAEFFRDQGKRVLLVMDSLTRFAMASREIGLSLGEPPTVKGYTPSIFSMLPRLLERAGAVEGKGSITGFYTILMESDDINDPIADAVRSIVDGHIVLTRKLAMLGHYPAIDIMQSISRVMRNVTTERHHEIMQKVRRALVLYHEMEDFVKIGAYVPGKNRELDQVLALQKDINAFVCQRMTEGSRFEETMARLEKLAQDLGA